MTAENYATLVYAEIPVTVDFDIAERTLEFVFDLLICYSSLPMREKTGTIVK